MAKPKEPKVKEKKTSAPKAPKQTRGKKATAEKKGPNKNSATPQKLIVQLNLNSEMQNSSAMINPLLQPPMSKPSL